MQAMGVYRSKEVEDEIVNRLADGEFLREICRSEGMPSWRSVYDWIDADEEFASRVARARDRCLEARWQRCAETVNATPERYLTEHGDRVDPGYVAWQKLRAETEMKMIAKMDPKRYGDRIAHELTGKDGGAIEIDDRRALAKAILARATQPSTPTEGGAK